MGSEIPNKFCKISFFMLVFKHSKKFGNWIQIQIESKSKLNPKLNQHIELNQNWIESKLNWIKIELNQNWIESKLKWIQIELNPNWIESKLNWIQIELNSNWNNNS